MLRYPASAPVKKTDGCVLPAATNTRSLAHISSGFDRERYLPFHQNVVTVCSGMRQLPRSHICAIRSMPRPVHRHIAALSRPTSPVSRLRPGPTEWGSAGQKPLPGTAVIRLWADCRFTASTSFDSCASSGRRPLLCAEHVGRWASSATSQRLQTLPGR